MHLLQATDHRFLSHKGAIYDATCFDREFFDDYLAVFPSITVLCRTIPVDDLPSTAAPCDAEGLRFVSVGSTRGPRWQLGAGMWCASTIRREVAVADVVLGRLPSRLGDLAVGQAKRVGKPYMIELLGDPREAYRTRGSGPIYELASLVESSRVRRAAKGAAVASYVNRSILPAAYPAAFDAVCDYIPCIRMRAESIHSPKVFEMPAEPLRVALVAHLLPYKRHEDLIRALPLVGAAGASCRLDFAGDGPCRRTLERLSDELGVREMVRFRGHLCGPDPVKAMLDENELFALPSATEGLPRAMLEAMARGLPAIGSRAGGIPELLREEDRFDVGDHRAIAKLLVACAKNPSRLAKMSEHAVATAHSYSSGVLSPKRIALYKQLRAAA